MLAQRRYTAHWAESKPYPTCNHCSPPFLPTAPPRHSAVPARRTSVWSTRYYNLHELRAASAVSPSSPQATDRIMWSTSRRTACRSCPLRRTERCCGLAILRRRGSESHSLHSHSGQLNLHSQTRTPTRTRAGSLSPFQILPPGLYGPRNSPLGHTLRRGWASCYATRGPRAALGSRAPPTWAQCRPSTASRRTRAKAIWAARTEGRAEEEKEVVERRTEECASRRGTEMDGEDAEQKGSSTGRRMCRSRCGYRSHFVCCSYRSLPSASSSRGAPLSSTVRLQYCRVRLASIC